LQTTPSHTSQHDVCRTKQHIIDIGYTERAVANCKLIIQLALGTKLLLGFWKRSDIYYSYCWTAL